MCTQNYSTRSLTRPLLALAIMFAALLCAPGGNVVAAAGDLDLSFDTDGKVTTDFFGGLDNARAVIVQPDGKIIVAGSATNGAVTHFAVARYNTDGSLDGGFGTGGKMTVEFAGLSSAARGVALQTDGRIVLAGTAGTDFALVRLNTDGSIDNFFGTGGRVTTDFFGNSDIGNALVIQPDGRIVAAGAARDPEGLWHFALARYTVFGSPDSDFGAVGKVATSFGFASAIGDGPPVAAYAVTLQPADGKIVAAGKSVHDFAVTRYTPSGTLDLEFNTGGKQVFPFAGTFMFGEIGIDRTDRATSVVVQGDGKIVVGGSVQITGQGFGGGLARLTPDGRLDPSFSGNGLFISGPSSAVVGEQVIGLALQKNGKMVVAGRDVSFQSVRVNLDGTLDQTYSDDGRQTTDFASGQLDASEAVAVQPDGKIIVAGTVLNNGDFGLVRYLGDAPDVQCLYGLSRSRHRSPQPGDSGLVRVSAPSGCAWTAVSNAPWISIHGATAGAGDGSVSFVVEPSGPGIRTGTLTIAGQTFTVAQNGFKVALYYGGGQNLDVVLQPVVAGTGLLAQVDNFRLHGATTPTIPHLLQYDAVLFFQNNVTGPPTADKAGVGNVLADYVERGRGVVVSAFSPDGFEPILGRILTDGYLPLFPGNGFEANGTLVKLQPSHPVLQGVSDVSSGGHTNVTLTTNAQRLADWSDGRPAVGTKQPFGGRVVGLNLFPTNNPTNDRARLLANSLHWAASGPATHSSFTFATPGASYVESAGSAAVTVARSGPDLSEPASVEFSTVDSAAEVRCDAVTSTALARCDYSTTVLTLNFAPGESAKTVHVPLINDGHAEGQESLQVRLRRPFGAGLGQQITSTIVIFDNDAAGAANPFFNHPFFIRQHYLDFLAREPEEPGQTAWVNVLGNCPDVNNDPRCDRATVSSGFFRSAEFQLKGYYAFRFYRAGLARLPAYTEIVADMGELTGATSAEVFQRRSTLAQAFTERAEFLTRFPPSLTNAGYVNGLLDTYALQSIRTRDPANPETGAEITLTKAELINGLTAGTLTRAQVLRALVESREVDAREYNGAFVAMQYYGYLRRTPEQPGYQNWLNYLNAHPDDYRTMIKGFIDSVEYRLRFGQQ